MSSQVGAVVLRRCSSTERTLTKENFRSFLDTLGELEGAFSGSKLRDMDYHAFDVALTKVLANSVLVLAEERVSGAVVGCGKLVLDYKMHYGGACVGHVEDLIVLASRRGQGIGRMLLAELVHAARDARCYKIILQCADHNVAFYQKSDFAVRGNNMEMRLMWFCGFVFIIAGKTAS